MTSPLWTDAILGLLLSHVISPLPPLGDNVMLSPTNKLSELRLSLKLPSFSLVAGSEPLLIYSVTLSPAANGLPYPTSALITKPSATSLLNSSSTLTTTPITSNASKASCSV